MKTAHYLFSNAAHRMTDRQTERTITQHRLVGRSKTTDVQCVHKENKASVIKP